MLDPKPGEVFIDATVNGGGHSAAVAEKISPGGVLIGIDLDCDLIKAANSQFPISNFQSKIIFECDTYVHIKAIATRHGISRVDGILFDLGFSSYHIDQSGRGFSFQKDEPLDMRYNTKTNATTAKDIINHESREAIEDIIREYGGERFASSIARAIASARGRGEIATAGQLSDIIRRAIPLRYRGTRVHPATRTFQALRIAVNQELASLEETLPDASAILRSGGRLAVISFHSLEDRIVKNFFRQQEKIGAMRIVTKKPLRPSSQELRMNTRSGPARLRAAIKTGETII